MEEDAVVEELVDVVVVNVRIVTEDLMALKMRLLVVDAVVRLIEEDMDMDVSLGAVELATLIGRGLLMLLNMVTTTTNSLLFWPFRIKLLEASIIRVWSAEGRVQRLPEGGACNIKLTDDMQAFIRDEQEKLYNSLSPASLRLVRNWRFASQIRRFQTQP